MDLDGKRIFGVLLFMFIVTLGIVFENMALKTENAQLREYSIVSIGVTNNLDQGWYGAEGITKLTSNNNTFWVYDENTCVKTEYLPEYHPYREYKIIHQGILIHIVSKKECETRGIIPSQE